MHDRTFNETPRYPPRTIEDPELLGSAFVGHAWRSLLLLPAMGELLRPIVAGKISVCDMWKVCMALIAVLFAALTSYGALANNLKGTPRHACYGNACGQGATLPPCSGRQLTSFSMRSAQVGSCRA